MSVRGNYGVHAFAFTLLLITGSSCSAQVDLGLFASLNATDTAGQKEGIWVTYYSDPCIESIAFYRDGHLDGSFIAMYPDGTLQTFSTFDKGQREGISRSYNQEEHSIRVSEYHRGAVVRSNTYDEHGGLVVEDVYKDGKLVREIYHTKEGMIEGRPSSK